MASTFSFPLIVEGSPRKQLDGVGLKGQYDFVRRGTYQLVAFPVGVLQYGACDLTAETDFTADAETSTKFFDARRAIDDPLTLVGPINGNTVYTTSSTTSMTDTGPVRYALGRNDGYGDPVTYYLRGNSVNGVNRAGEVPSTPSGAVRYQPGPGGRINRHGNPRLANNSAGWNSYGGTFARVADPDMGGYAAEMTSTALNNGLAIRGDTVSALVVNTNVVTISFDFKWVSGQAGAWYMSFWTTNRGGNGTFYANEGGGAIPSTYYDGNIYRLSYTVTLNNYYKDNFQVLFLRGTSGITGTSTIRVTNLVIEEGKVANPTYFDGDTEGAVWANHLTGVPGTPHTTSSFTNAALWFEEGTTNLVVDPAAVSGTPATSWWALTPATVSRDFSAGYYNAGSVKVVTAGSYGWEGYGFSTNALSYAAGTARTFAGSVWVRGTQGSKAVVVMRIWQNNSQSATDNYSTFTFTGSWQRVSAITTSNSSLNVHVCEIAVVAAYGGTNAITFWMTNAQIEERAYTTTYCDGSLGTGYSWSGTANASTSSRALSNFSIPSYGNFPIRRGAFSAWIKPITGYWWFFAGNYNSIGFDAIYFAYNANNCFDLYASTHGAVVSFASYSFKRNEWNFLYIDWDERTIRISVNNGAFSVGQRSMPLNVQNDTILLNGGSSLTVSTFQIQHVTLYDQPLPTSNLSRLYNSGTPWTTYGHGTMPPTYPRWARINLCRNPRLENGWLDWLSYNGGTYSLTTGDKTSKAARITANGLGTGAGFAIKGRPSVAYLVSFNARVVRGSTTNWGIGAQSVRNDGTIVASPLLYSINNLSTSWSRVSTMVYVTDFGTDRINILFTPRVDSGGVLDIEQIVVEEVHAFPKNFPASYFDGDTPGAKWADPWLLVPGTAHASPSISAVAPFFEPANTNLILNPNFEAELGDDTVSANNATLQRSTLFAYTGTYSLRVQTPGVVSASEGVILRSARNLGTTTARTFSASVYLRAPISNLTLQVVPLVAYTDGSIVYGSYQVAVVAGHWFRFTPASITTSATKTLDYVGVLIYIPGVTSATWYVDNAQIEERSHVTTYTDGSLGTGYAWTGTANASASTRADTTAAVANAASVISPSTGAVAFWYYRTVTVSNTYEMVNIGYYGTNDYISVFQGPGVPPAIRTKNGSATPDEAQWSASPTVLQNVWHFVYADWTPTTLRIAVDGGTPVTANRTGGVSGSFRTGYTELRFGRNLVNEAYRLFGAMTPVQVFNRTLTATEINDLYAGGLPVTEPISATQLTAGAITTHNALTLLTGETEAIPRPNRITRGVAPDDGQGDFSATALVNHATIAALDADSTLKAESECLCEALAALSAVSDGTFSESVQCDATAALEADSDAAFVESVLCDAFSELDADSDFISEAIADCAAEAALDADTGITADSICDVAASASLDSDSNADLIAIANVPGDVWMTADGSVTADGAVIRAGLAAVDAAADATAVLNGAYRAYLSTAMVVDTGFPPIAISAVPLPYLQGTTDLGEWVTVAGLPLPALYVTYIDGGLLLANGGVIRPAFATVDASSDLGADALNMVDGSAAFSAETELETGALWEGVAALYGDGTLTAVPAVTRDAASAQSALSASAADAVAHRDGISTPTAVSDLTAAAIADVPAQADMDAAGELAAPAIVEHVAQSDLTVATDLSADSIALVPDSALIEAVGAVTATGTVRWAATAVLSTDANSVCAPTAVYAGGSGCIAATNVTATGVRRFSPALGPDGTGTVNAFAGLIFSDDADLVSESQFLSDALADVPAFATEAGEGDFAAVPDVIGAPPLLVVPATLARLNVMPVLVAFSTNPILKAVDVDERPDHDPSLAFLPSRPVLKLVKTIPTLAVLKE